MDFVCQLIAIFCLLIASQEVSGCSQPQINYTYCLASLLSIQNEFDINSYFILEDILHCDAKEGLSLFDDDCITMNEETQLIEVGQCIYSHGREVTHNDYVLLPINSSTFTDHSCSSFHRGGTLCGRCEHSYYPLVYSFDMTCVKCPNSKANWWKFVLVAFVPITILYIIILLFKVDVTSRYLEGFVLYCQVISMPSIARSVNTNLTNSSSASMLTLYHIIGSLFGIWNLDTLRFYSLGICFDITPLQTLILDLVVGAYPIILILSTYILIRLYDKNVKVLRWFWKPFRALLHILGGNFNNIGTSLVNTFAAFFFLSYVKLLTVSVDLLAPVQVYHINTTGKLTYSWRLFYDATLLYFGREHFPYAILGITVAALSILLPLLLFIFYPFRWFQRILNIFPFRWYILHTFMDTFQGCYKDGTVEGSHDFRWFSSVPFIARVLIAVVGTLTLGSSYFPPASMLLVFITIFIVQFQPYKAKFQGITSVNLIFYLILTLSHICVLGDQLMQSKNRIQLVYIFHIANCVIAASTFMYITFIILLRIYNYRHQFGLEYFRGWLAGCKIM